MYQKIVDELEDRTVVKPNVKRSIEKLRKIMSSFPEAAKEMSMESLKKKDRLIRVKIGVLESRLNTSLLSEKNLHKNNDEKNAGHGCSNSSGDTEF